MSAPLFVTKLYFPQIRSNLVERPRLVQILEKGLQGPLMLISAPAGSGKTTLMGEWRANSRYKTPIAWLSLDSGDNDPLRFLTYLTASVESASPSWTHPIAPLLQSPQSSSSEIIVTSWLESLSTLTNDLILVLDDYHVITNITIHEILNRILEYSPPAFHLVILTRADPPLPLARLRVRDQLTEIRGQDLRFTVNEVSAFLSQTMGLMLSQEKISSLEAHTEGWIAAPVIEELYFRGYLLPRLSRFGRWTPVLAAALFTLYHFWQPYYWITQFINLFAGGIYRVVEAQRQARHHHSCRTQHHWRAINSGAHPWAGVRQAGV